MSTNACLLAAYRLTGQYSIDRGGTLKFCQMVPVLMNHLTFALTDASRTAVPKYTFESTRSFIWSGLCSANVKGCKMNDSLNAVRLDIRGKRVDVVLEYKNATGIHFAQDCGRSYQGVYGMQRIHFSNEICPNKSCGSSNQYVHQNGDLKSERRTKVVSPARTYRMVYSPVDPKESWSMPQSCSLS